MGDGALAAERRGAWVKVVGGVLVVAGLVAVAWWQVTPVQFFETVVDQDSRPLVVISTQGGDRAYDLQVRSSVDSAGSLNMTFHFTVDDVSYGEPQPSDVPVTPFAVEYSIVAAGSFAPEAFTCGTSADPVARQPYAELPVGTQSALTIDASAGLLSAINYRGSTSIDVAGGQYQEFSGSIWVVDDETHYSSRQEVGGTVYAETCTLATEAVWRWDQSVAFEDAPRRSYLAPQVNFTSLGPAHDYQRALSSDITIDRSSGMVLAEGYPTPSTGINGYSYQNTAFYTGSLGDQGYLAYTDQPVFIFANRDIDVQQSRLLFWGGAALGLAGALAVSVLSRLTDLATSLRRRNEPSR